MKKAFGIFFIVVLIVLMAACSNSSISGTGDVTNNSGSSLPENFVMLDAGEWPQNEYTANIPKPESGTLLYGWINPDEEYCCLELSDITQAESEQYVTALKEAGFTEIEKVSEQIKGDYISVGILLINDDTSVSISYIDDLLGMCISKKP